MKHFHGTARQERALNVYVKLLRAADTVDSLLMSQVESAGLTPSQFGVLEALYHIGSLCLGELARKILKTSGNLTMVVRNLERRGLVTRTRQAADKRYYLVAITAKGRRLIAQLFPKHLERMVDLMSALTPSEQETLAALARKLGTTVAADRNGDQKR
ncbi:MAG TPA: MarR family transcriptional regulator [Terriglobales bacterium]|jgi:MarR family 2-MHQ and catechol resistance regulon transcriptional repressor|nr:MarR family transcriptional regulator [Terriglobales bacterium]